ncbi:hypothetical protein MLD38_030968 [Melastoma candidum]|uniref:Uncharacterized protein n=1 Tax=Melastoma candidum TaxID=119954 RepID=A0ACB9MN93_9MYRT|nr:hypothetical protein MLD38_030968 [Melastoma candidum]
MSIYHRNSIVARSLLRDLLSRGPVPVTVNRELRAANRDSNPPVGSGKEGEDKEKEKGEGRLHIPQPPEMPEPGDCCGSGCVRCVWDVYQDELKAYEDIWGALDPTTTPIDPRKSKLKGGRGLPSRPSVRHSSWVNFPDTDFGDNEGKMRENFPFQNILESGGRGTEDSRQAGRWE